MSVKGKYDIDNSKIRVYAAETSIVFKKNNDSFGELSNMSMRFPLNINGIKVLNTEALYQACRFPNDIDLQKRIIFENSPMKVKMISKASAGKSREDWDDVKLKVMKWCIRVKLAQNFVSFGIVLDRTKSFYIVENSSRDNFWGAIPNKDLTKYTGQNALGRLLMELREEYRSEKKYRLLEVVKPDILDFKLFGENVDDIDGRSKFLKDLEIYWNNEQMSIFEK
ncbi:NADAR family protein [Sphingobacterium thalpophilum]|uniref:NADAR family protein n=1 Tax=Sphingobacterium thalpophilum TaxID=259 RepID=UPI003D9920DA